jgi:hypothetical protein
VDADYSSGGNTVLEVSFHFLSPPRSFYTGEQMAGVRQHILPRFLLKGFASRLDAQEVFTWVFRKGGNVFEANIKNVAVEKHFYSQPANTSVDDHITQRERGFARLLDNLRSENDGFKIIDPTVPEFVSHLTSRTKHLRDSFIETTGVMTQILSDYLADVRNVRRWLFELLQKTSGSSEEGN